MTGRFLALKIARLLPLCSLRGSRTVFDNVGPVPELLFRYRLRRLRAVCCRQVNGHRLLGLLLVERLLLAVSHRLAELLRVEVNVRKPRVVILLIAVSRRPLPARGAG